MRCSMWVDPTKLEPLTPKTLVPNKYKSGTPNWDCYNTGLVFGVYRNRLDEWTAVETPKEIEVREQVEAQRRKRNEFGSGW